MNTASNMATTPTTLSPNCCSRKNAPIPTSAAITETLILILVGTVKFAAWNLEELVGWYRGCSCLARQQRFGLKILLDVMGVVTIKQVSN